MIAAESPLLSVAGLQVRFGDDAPAVRQVDLTVRTGQTVAIVGESGSGKSTTAAAILGLLAPGGRITAGRIVFDGVDLTAADQRRLRAIRGTGIGYVPQDPMTNLNPVWKVGFQVREALRANNISSAKKQAVQLLADAGMPDPVLRARQYPHQLSGGMCQRALIAIGLAGRPRLLIADELTSALDVTVQRQVLDHLQHLTGELGTAVLLITHDLALAAERAERLIVMHRGAVVETGAAQLILQDPQHPYTQSLVAAAPSLCDTSTAARTRQRVTHAASEHAGPNVSEDVVVASKLTKVYRPSRGAPWRRAEVRAVDDVSFRLRRATTLAIAGESGSGKSTLARMVLGLLQPSSGTVVFDGLNITDTASLSRRETLAFRRRVQPVFQNPYGSLNPRQTIGKALQEPLLVNTHMSAPEREAAALAIMAKVGLRPEFKDRYPHMFSGGQRQRIAIARALLKNAPILILDEATSHLDTESEMLVQRALANLMAGRTVIVIAHRLSTIRRADKIVVLEKGRVRESGTHDQLMNQEGIYRRLHELQFVTAESAVD